MTKTGHELIMEIAERHAPNRLDELVDEYVRTLDSAESRLVAGTELRKFAEWFREKHSGSRRRSGP
jgi:hypothetical protein